MQESSHERSEFYKESVVPRRKKPSTYGRIVTGNVDGTAVVESDEPLLASPPGPCGSRQRDDQP
jgi:hypothetical protein